MLGWLKAYLVGMFCDWATKFAWYGALLSRLKTACVGAWWWLWNVPITCRQHDTVVSCQVAC